MNPLHKHLALLCTGVAATLPTAAWSQSQPSAAAAGDEEVTRLATFTITETAANPYQSGQALSASRVAMPIQDIPQTVSVVTNEFLKDSMSFRMLDAAKYVTPISESTLPYGGDRYTIRGFQVSHEFIDGTEISGQDGYSMSIVPYNIERIEIIKGPNAILVPGGSPGGQMNPITKSPIMKDQSSATLQLGQYFSNALSTDLNRVLNDKMAARLVLAYWDSDGYARNQFRRGYMIAPSFSWQLTPTNKLVVKAEFMQNRETNLGGLPLDPSVGTDTSATIAKGLPRDWSFAGDDRWDQRHRATERITMELFSDLGDHVSSRLQLMANHVTREDQGGTSAAIKGTLGSRNPNTGKYEPGVIWSLDQTGPTAVATSTPVAIPDPGSYVYSRTYGAVDLWYSEAHLRNEYAIKFDTDLVKSTTVAGLAGNFSKVQFKSYEGVARPDVPANALGSATYPHLTYLEPALTNTGGNRTGKQEDLQLFVYENASFLRDRVQLSGGVSRFFGQLSRIDQTGLAPAMTYPSYNLSTTAKTFGAVIKPIKPVSLFYGYNTSGGTMPSSLNPGTYAPNFRVAAGTQKEYGVKVSTLDGRLTGSFSYFNIEQENYAVPNSEYYSLVALGKFAEAAALQNPLYLNLTSKGWEFEATYALSSNLTLIGNYTSYKARQPITDVPIRGVPDHAGAIYVDYRFTEGALHGFSVNVGVDYKSEVAGDSATGYTTTKPLPGGNFVPNQPSFYVNGRTLVNVGFAYKRDQWTARLQVSNVFDKDYLLASLSRTAVLVGDPLNVKASFTYNF
ncbi:MAG TPA: TonB-dependent receptor plug domain-containing protein [Opitutus sp.]|nr:TonB-dependent receptor plug domain-containing protein [Opitutus sp.]